MTSTAEPMLTNLEKTPWPWFGGKADAMRSMA